jgi:hypothetical protein
MNGGGAKSSILGAMALDNPKAMLTRNERNFRDEALGFG